MKNLIEDIKKSLFLLLCIGSFSANAPLLGFDPVIILIGPPGGGKGSFSQYLKENYGYIHISIGDILRQEIELQTELGCRIKEIVRRGDYIDPQIINELFAKKIKQFYLEERPMILDGFGQNEGDLAVIQSQLEEAGLISRTFVLYLQASDEICFERITNRLVCLSCGHVYNVITAAPEASNQCNHCGKELKTKINDTPKVILKRLRHYRETIEKYYKEAMSLFPSFVYNTSGSFEECSHFYDRLVLETQKSKTDARTFIKQIYLLNVFNRIP